VEKIQKNETEDERIEYQSLRAELNQADNTCLIMTGFIFTALGALFSIEDAENVLWISSLLCLIGLFYYTEKRFVIRKISFFIKDIISTEETGFKWEKYVDTLRKNDEFRPSWLFRPYHFEVLICILGSLSPLLYPEFIDFKNNLSSIVVWILITLIVIALSFTNIIKYNKLKSTLTKNEFLKKNNNDSKKPSA
jgi:hypothetical protein